MPLHVHRIVAATVLVFGVLTGVRATAQQSPTERLVAEFGYGEGALDEVDDVQVAADYAKQMEATARERLTEVGPSRARLGERVKLLEEFAQEEGLDPPEVAQRVRRLALARAHVAMMKANVAHLEHEAASLQTESQLLANVIGALKDQVVEQTTEDAEQQKELEEQEALQKQLEQEEDEARRKAELARRREEATKDEALKQLFARERKLRDQLVEIATTRRELTELKARSDELADQFSATKGSILGRLDALPEEPTDEQRRTVVDPLLHDILIERRQLWDKLGSARDRADAARAAVETLNAEVEAAQRALEAEGERKQELGGGELWKQRVKVAEAELELAQAKLDDALAKETQTAELVALLERGVEFLSAQLRKIVDRASGEGRSEVYSLLDEDAISDAWRRLNDRFHAATRLLESRAAAGRSLGDQGLALAVWVAQLTWRLFLALLLMAALRFVPGITRQLLDFMQARKFFRRRPSAAIKLFELLRATARPLLLYGGIRIVLAYVIESFNELVFLQWAVDAFFVYLVGARIAAAVALPRWYREREGLASSGKENDLRSDEAAIADVLRLDLDRGTKFVRSARIVLAVGTVWYFAPSIVVALTGVSVLSGLITNLTRFAIAIVVYWTISTWRDELSGLFTRLAGNRLPKATKFVENNKDKLWGVLVVAVVSVVVLVWELVKFVRRVVRNTEWFKKASAYAFKTKIELQQRDEPTEEQIKEFLPDDLEHAFGPGEVVGTARIVERANMLAAQEDFERFSKRGYGALCLVGEPGIGKTVTCKWLLEEHHHVTLDVSSRIFQAGSLLELFRDALDGDFQTVGELIEVLEGEPPTTFFLDGLERCFLRDIDGYGAYRELMELVHRLNRKHIWLFAVSRFAWDFLTRVYDQRHVFHAIHTLPRWTDEELRHLVEKRMADLPYSTSFSDLADAHGTDYAEVVKTARGYYRYLAEFTRGSPSTAMHYWLRSLSGGTHKVYSVGLFSRPSGAALVAAPPQYRFMLAAIVQHGELTPSQAARVDNTPVGTCELAAEYFRDAGAIVVNGDDAYSLAPPFYPITLRHLEDSNLL